MALSRALSRRIGRLESLPRVLFAEDKWDSIHVAALQSLSEDDRRLWGEIQVVRDSSGNSSDLTPAREAVMERYYDALVDGMADQRRFTVSELDELLAAA